MRKILILLLSLAVVDISLISCSNKSPANPPYNNFNQSSDVPKDALLGAGAGAAVGAIVSPEAPGVGAIIGGAAGAAIRAFDTAYQESPENLITLLATENIQVVQDGKRVTLLVPTDIYYLPNSYDFDDVWYQGLIHIAQLVLRDSDGMVYVAGFSDSGFSAPSERLKLSQQRAQSMADFLWANGVSLHRLVVKGYGERFDIADNFLVHGAAMNRRVEIQWYTKHCPALSNNVCED